MNRKDRIKLAISKKLNKVFTHRSGVGNKADPTAWDVWTFTVRNIELGIHASWEPTLQLRGIGTKAFFVSSAIHKWLYPAVKLLWKLLEFEQWEDYIDANDGMDDRLSYDTLHDINDLLEECDYPPGMALEQAELREQQRADDAATCPGCGYFKEYCRCDEFHVYYDPQGNEY